MKLATTKSVAVLSFMSAALLGSAGVTAASPNPAASPSIEQEQELRDLLTKFSVPSDQQDSLVQTAASGQAWDVYDQTKKPISVEKDQVIDGFRYTISRYQDGSVSAQGIEIPAEVEASTPPGVARGISQCQVSSGSGYRVFRNCQIDNAWGSVLFGAYGMNFSVIQGAPDSISGAGAGFQKCVWPTNCSTPNLVLFKGREDGQGAAYARWQGDVSATWGSWNAWVQLNVGGDGYWQTNS